MKTSDKLKNYFGGKPKNPMQFHFQEDENKVKQYGSEPFVVPWQLEKNEKKENWFG